MSKTPTRQIVAHTRLAVEHADGIALFTPGETITVGKIVSAEQADAWLACGSAGPVPTAPIPATDTGE